MSQVPEPEVVETAGRRWTVSRRGFLIGLATAGGALALGIPLGLPLLRRAAARLTEGDVGGFMGRRSTRCYGSSSIPTSESACWSPRPRWGRGFTPRWPR